MVLERVGSNAKYGVPTSLDGATQFPGDDGAVTQGYTAAQIVGLTSYKTNAPQEPNTFLASPSSWPPATSAFRAIGYSDLPTGLNVVDIPITLIGTPTASQAFPRYVFTRAMTVPYNFGADAVGAVGTNPSASYAVTVQFLRGGVLQASGTITISTSGAFTFSLASAYSAQKGDVMVPTEQASASPAPADIAFTIPAVRA